MKTAYAMLKKCRRHLPAPVCLMRALHPLQRGLQRFCLILSRKMRTVITVVSAVDFPATAFVKKRNYRNFIRYTVVRQTRFPSKEAAPVAICSIPPPWRSPLVKKIVNSYRNAQRILLYGLGLAQLPSVRQIMALC